ncbi:uncharacterized protein BCR38DRAFT_429626 [Pseudomassariella vexata]|uniref:DUF7053 domain-containing protein n=1 Tax=Pseudomassariella vexata TaxID=1141098 RepID=A0A1Y2E4E8_9PEZI|nr:uncharacterized protein BCR38DRAFT_429626 [Pseudomassariella vexata]ORY66224.1 hypothetical protein BCR38DRAFT_429626 [Pseudomassariella vexata]
MSFLISTANLTKTTGIPLPVSKATAIAILHDHDIFLNTDPHVVKYTSLAPAVATDVAKARAEYKIPAAVDPIVGTPPVRVYEMLDHVPNPVWSSEVVSREELVNYGEGLWTRVKSPMGVVMETFWFARERKDGGCELVQEVCVSCNRMLMGLVKSQVEENFQVIHDKLIEAMVKKQGAA